MRDTVVDESFSWFLDRHHSASSAISVTLRPLKPAEGAEPKVLWDAGKEVL